MFTFFLWKTPKACLLMQGARSSCDEAVLKVSWLRWIACCHILYRADLENVNHLLQWTRNLRRTLGVLRAAFFVGSFIRVFCYLIIRSFLFLKEALQWGLLFHSSWLGLACGLTKTVIKTNAQCGKELSMEVVNKIICAHAQTEISVGFWLRACYQIQLCNWSTSIPVPL